ncbi:mother-specific HO expression [Knufia obscura]|uniref:Mother-specific HO expression n=2 Tax=Knufia TaxID=430999 RepID=A0AAN8ET43_9EURO|nr:mother-specific HO expression [Knufia obscura]KAK5953056.1 mother-specific HO expression [Knufia fluminis]
MANFTAWILRRKTGKRKRHSTNVAFTEASDKEEEYVDPSANMAQANGIHREKTPIDTSIVPPGRVISTSMMRQAAIEQTPSPDSTQWSSAIGHASTGKSGRVIERLQQEIDRLNREKQLLKLRHEEAERATETLHSQYRYLQDRNSNYESSHEANLRQLQRKERQVEDLREEVQKEKLKTARAEEALRTAAVSEDEWREQASHAKAIAQQKESEYDAIAACRNMDNDRHQNGLERIKASLDELLRKREDDLEKQKRMEIISEQRKKETEQLEELTKRLQVNFNSYRTEIDSAIDGLRSAASENDRVVHEKVEEMRRVTGDMRWVMNVETVVNGRQVPPRPAGSHESQSDEQSFITAQSKEASKEALVEQASAPPSPSKKMSLDFRRHRRKGSTKAGK